MSTRAAHLQFSRVARAAGFTSLARTTISIFITKGRNSVCAIHRNMLDRIHRGSCTVRISVKPRAGKPQMRRFGIVFLR